MLVATAGALAHHRSCASFLPFLTSPDLLVYTQYEAVIMMTRHSSIQKLARSASAELVHGHLEILQHAWKP